jgi:hypothetical protein
MSAQLRLVRPRHKTGQLKYMSRPIAEGSTLKRRLKPIIAQLIKSDRCSAEGLEVRRNAPALTMCRNGAAPSIRFSDLKSQNSHSGALPRLSPKRLLPDALRIRLGLPAGGIYAARGIRPKPGSEIRQPCDPLNQMIRTIRRLRRLITSQSANLKIRNQKGGPSRFQSFNRLKYLSDIDDRSTSLAPKSMGPLLGKGGRTL